MRNLAQTSLASDNVFGDDAGDSSARSRATSTPATPSSCLCRSTRRPSRPAVPAAGQAVGPRPGPDHRLAESVHRLVRGAPVERRPGRRCVRHDVGRPHLPRGDGPGLTCRPSGLVGGGPEGGQVELLHPHHGAHGPVAPLAWAGHQLDEALGDDLPRQAIAVPEPSALDLLPAVGEPVPVVAVSRAPVPLSGAAASHSHRKSHPPGCGRPPAGPAVTGVRHRVARSGQRFVATCSSSSGSNRSSVSRMAERWV